MKHSSMSRRIKLNLSPVVASYMEALDCPRSLSIYLAWKYDQAELLKFECNPKDYPDLESFHRAYLATGFLKKFNGLKSGVNTRDAAMQSFWDAEQQCKETNRRLRQSDPQGLVGEVFSLAREKIRKLLPEVNSNLIDEVIDLAEFGPGVTSSCKGKFLSVYDKLLATPEATPAICDVCSAEVFQRTFPAWSLSHPTGLRMIPGNTLATVPKNSKTDRTIAIEPSFNAFLQRGVGKLIRSHLLKWKVNLRDQGWNQKLAREGSISGRYDTIDLKAASDTVSIETVRRLLPPKWALLLENLRSEFFRFEDSWVRYHKHSSMGNGYTFELETLLFTALVKGCLQVLGIEDRFAVYGDDIVVPSAATDLLMQCLTFFGFTPNVSKTHRDSPFRESCGADWYLGVQCTPFYFRRKDDAVQVVVFANWLRTTAPSWLDIRKVWLATYWSVPKDWRVRGPAPKVSFKEWVPMDADKRQMSSCSFWTNWWEVDPTAQILYRRPYGPVIGFKSKVVHFVPAKRGVPDSGPSLAGSLLRLSRLPHYYMWMALEGQSIPAYERSSTGRELGRWRLRSVINDDWPEVRGL